MCPAPPCKPFGEQEAKGQVPLQRAELDGTAISPGKAEGAAPAAPLTFRDKPIAWVVAPTMRKSILPNAFGEDEIVEEQRGVKHLIDYEGKQFSREEFLTMAFPGEYKKYPYKVHFKSDDIFRLGGN